MQQLKPADVVIAGGGFVGLTLAKETTARPVKCREEEKD
jgi:2-polyprenyl-6-methoxyphenol hydroxylase-like FAD-dependent oxidoreductase